MLEEFQDGDCQEGCEGDGEDGPREEIHEDQGSGEEVEVTAAIANRPICHSNGMVTNRVLRFVPCGSRGRLCFPSETQPAFFSAPFWVSCGSPSQESQGAGQAAPDCAVARKFGKARIFGGTHTNPGWTFFSAPAIQRSDAFHNRPFDLLGLLPEIRGSGCPPGNLPRPANRVRSKLVRDGAAAHWPPIPRGGRRSV